MKKVWEKLLLSWTNDIFVVMKKKFGWKLIIYYLVNLCILRHPPPPPNLIKLGYEQNMEVEEFN
jgi:hypothetical protein